MSGGCGKCHFTGTESYRLSTNSVEDIYHPLQAIKFVKTHPVNSRPKLRPFHTRNRYRRLYAKILLFVLFYIREDLSKLNAQRPCIFRVNKLELCILPNLQHTFIIEKNDHTETFFSNVDHITGNNGCTRLGGRESCFIEIFETDITPHLSNTSNVFLGRQLTCQAKT